MNFEPLFYDESPIPKNEIKVETYNIVVLEINEEDNNSVNLEILNEAEL